jgi:hypothetical protein
MENTDQTPDIWQGGFGMLPDRLPTGTDEATVIEVLSERIAEMMEHQLDYLLSLMYRLDIEEEDLQRVLRPGYHEPAHLALAKLVWKRQQQRQESRATYRNNREDTSKWDWSDE